jgi:hypothetical protein
MQLLGAKETDRGTIEVTFGTQDGVHVLEGRADEIGELGERMQEASRLGSTTATAPGDPQLMWLPEVPVGRDVVSFGIGGRGVRVRITRDPRAR